MSKDKEENKNIYNDPSVKTGKNHCSNPNMNVNGIWCFVQNEDVSQSFGKSILEYWSKLFIDFFQNLGDELKWFAAYIRDKFLEIVEGRRKNSNKLDKKFLIISIPMDKHLFIYVYRRLFSFFVALRFVFK